MHHISAVMKSCEDWADAVSYLDMNLWISFSPADRLSKSYLNYLVNCISQIMITIL